MNADVYSYAVIYSAAYPNGMRSEASAIKPVEQVLLGEEDN